MAVYWVYALIAVPLIEPTIELTENSQASNAELEAARKRPIAQHDQLKSWFKAGDWELTSPKVLETAREKLLFKDYENGKDGKLRLRPCTLIFLPNPTGKTTEQINREAIVLQSEGADLQFDQRLSVASGKIGALTSGVLHGKFTIRSDQKEPGPQDDLWIVGRDAELIDHRVVSPHPIEFRLGSSHGSGRELRIELLSDNGKSASGVGFNGVQSIEIRRDVILHLDVAGLEKARQGPNAKPAPNASPARRPQNGLAGMVGGSPNAPQPPLQITSRGPFQFDMLKFVATFRDHVDVLRIHPQGQSDHLKGDLLSLFFTPSQNQAAPGRFPKLEASRLEVRGLPVVMESTKEDMDARGEFLMYELESGRVSLEGKQPATLRRGPNRIEAPKLEYEPSARSQYGRFSAVGPGLIDAATPANQGQHFRARWKQQAIFGPDPTSPRPNLYIVSLLGDAFFEEQRAGSLAGEEIYVWLIEQPASPTPQLAGQRRPPPFVPDRMLANGHVRLQSPQVNCNVEKLQAWFVADGRMLLPRSGIEELPTPPPAPQAPQGRDPNRPAPGNPLSTAVHQTAPSNHAGTERHKVATVQYSARFPDSRAGHAGVPRADGDPRPQTSAATGPLGMPANRSKYFVVGKTLQVELRLVGSTAPEVKLSKLRVQEKVQVTESFLGPVDGAPLRLTGDQVDYEQTSDLDGKLSVVGEPAHIEGRGVTLEGPQVRLNRATSELDVDGAGQMLLPASQDLEGKRLQQPRPLLLTWQRRMHFDGRIAHFENQIVAKLDERVMHAGNMQVAFAVPVNFASPPRDRQPEVAEVTCRENVTLDDRTLDDHGQLTAVQRMQAASITVNRQTGGITAEGPGWMTSVRRGSLTPPDDSQPRVQPVAHSTAEQLIYLKVAFQTLATGNLYQRVMQFGNHVRTVFGPVQAWDGVVNPDDFDRMGPTGKPTAVQSGVLNSDQLEMLQIRGPAGDYTVALKASGNAQLEGVNFQEQSFFAQAHQIMYDQSKDLIVLEGDGRTDAELSQQERVGAAIQRTTSRKINFWPPMNGRQARVYADGARHADLSMPAGGFNRATAPRGAAPPMAGTPGGLGQPRPALPGLGPAITAPATANRGTNPYATDPDPVANDLPSGNYPTFGADRD